MAAGGNDGYLYRETLNVRLVDGSTAKKVICIQILENQDQIIYLFDEYNPFTLKILINTESSYDISKINQNLKSEYCNFPLDFVALLSKTKIAESGFYLALIDDLISTTLTVQEETSFAHVPHLAIVMRGGTKDEVKNVAMEIINELKAKASLKEQAYQSAQNMCEEMQEKLIRADLRLAVATKNLDKMKAQCAEEGAVLREHNHKKIEELEKGYVDTFYSFQKEKEEEMRSLKITNKSLDVLNRILETENALIKKQLRKESTNLNLANKAKEQVDKDVKILKAKITKYNMELKENHIHCHHLKNEIIQLKKIEMICQEQKEELEAVAARSEALILLRGQEARGYQKDLFNVTYKLNQTKTVIANLKECHEAELQKLNGDVQKFKSDTSIYVKTLDDIQVKLVKYQEMLLNSESKFRKMWNENVNLRKKLLKTETNKNPLLNEVEDPQTHILVEVEDAPTMSELGEKKEQNSMVNYLNAKFPEVTAEVTPKPLEQPISASRPFMHLGSTRQFLPLLPLTQDVNDCGQAAAASKNPINVIEKPDPKSNGVSSRMERIKAQHIRYHENSSRVKNAGTCKKK